MKEPKSETKNRICANCRKKFRENRPVGRKRYYCSKQCMYERWSTGPYSRSINLNERARGRFKKFRDDKFFDRANDIVMDLFGEFDTTEEYNSTIESCISLLRGRADSYYRHIATDDACHRAADRYASWCTRDLTKFN